MRRTGALIVLMLLFPGSLVGQDEGDPVIVAHRHAVPSAVLEKERPVRIGLPAGYDPAEAYPVIYVLDGESQFLHTYSSMRFLASAGRMPSAIVVGVDNTGDDRPANLRPPMVGGRADQFAAFLSDELKPWVEARYSTRPFSMLIGHSLGGLFATYLLNTEPESFSSYIAISPSLQALDGEYVATTDDVFDRFPEARASWYMTVGDEGGGMLAGAWRLAGTLEEHAPRSFRWNWKHMPTETHGSVPARTVYDGLEWTFEGFNPVALWAELGDSGAKALPRIEEHFASLSRMMGYTVSSPVGPIGQIAAQLGQLEGRHEDALAITRQLVAWAPESPMAHFRRGGALALACRLDDARASYAASAELARVAYGPEDPLTVAMARQSENLLRQQENCAYRIFSPT